MYSIRECPHDSLSVHSCAQLLCAGTSWRANWPSVPSVATLVLYLRTRRPSILPPARPGSFSGEVPAGTANELPVTPFNPAPAGYEILGELGRGGMGVVYKAMQSVWTALVALKMILAGPHAGPSSWPASGARPRPWPACSIPTSCRSTKSAKQDGRPFFSLEYVAGGSLASSLRGKPRALRGGRAAGGDPGPGHPLMPTEHGIVHRDLKPANVLLQIANCKLQNENLPKDNLQFAICNLQFAIPKITDFGLAKRWPRTRTGSGGPTQTRCRHGHAQLHGARSRPTGKVKDIGPAADIYALGAILYEMLTGRPPFRATTAAGHLDAGLHRGAGAAVAAAAADCPRDLETICLKCLQKEPAQALCQRRGPGRRPAPFPGRRADPGPAGGSGRTAGRWCRRNPVVAGLLAALVLVFAAGFGGVVWKWRDEKAASEEAAQQAKTAREAEDRAKKQARAAPLPKRLRLKPARGKPSFGSKLCVTNRGSSNSKRPGRRLPTSTGSPLPIATCWKTTSTRPRNFSTIARPTCGAGSGIISVAPVPCGNLFPGRRPGPCYLCRGQPRWQAHCVG